MLRRNSCRSQNHRPLSKSRSSVSIVRNPVHELTSIEPFAAERDAYLAATLSYNRAQPQSNGGGKTPRLHRQQSVRFAGPNAQPHRRLATRASMAMVGNINMPQRPVGSQHLSQSSFEPGDDAISLSYARLRKSRSMYTPSITKTPNYSLDTGDHSDMFDGWLATPRYPSLAKKENEPLRSSDGPALRAPKSMGFLSNDCERSASRASTISGHVSDQQVQDGFYEPSVRSTRLNSRPSSFFRSNYKYTLNPTSFPKSLRNSSNNTAVLSSTHVYGSNIASNPLSKQPGLRTTARKISKSLKSRLKGLFSRPKSRDHTADQTEEYIRDFESNDGSCYRAQIPTQSPQEASLYRVVSHMPSLHAVLPSQQLRSRQGSLGTIEAEDNMLPGDDKSRVTSWTNSTAATIANRPSSANWSSQYTYVLQQDDMEAFPSSHNQTSMYHDNPSQVGPIVNSQRVYSALMKRLEETQRHQNQSLVQDHMTPDPLEANSSRSTSTIRRQTRQSMYEGSTHTIRHVQYEDDVFQDRVGRAATSRYSSQSTKSVIMRHESSDSLQNFGHETCPSPDSGGGSSFSTSKSVMKPRKVAETQKPPLSSRSSAFFASPTCHLFRTTSPYRRALQESMKAAQASNQPQTPDTQYLSSLSALSLPTRRSSTEGSDEDVRVAYAESVYSSPSEQNTPHIYAPSSPSRLAKDEAGTKVHGDATIFLTSERQRPPPSSHHARDSSSASSVEWKTWLSANVSKLESPSTTLKTDFPQEPSSAPQTYRHVREKTEIESDGDDLSQDLPGAGLTLRLAPSKDNRSPSALTAMARTKFHLANPWHPQSTATNENSPPTSGARSKSLCSKDASPVGSKGNLRTIPSVPNVNTYASGTLESPLGSSGVPSLNTLAKPCAPVSLKRQPRVRPRPNNTSAKSSPGFTTALERQFGVSKTGSPGVWKSTEPSGEVDCALGSEADAGVDELGRRELDAQAMGSRRMVDLFLSSRRKRTASSQMRQSSDSLSAAFI